MHPLNSFTLRRLFKWFNYQQVFFKNKLNLKDFLFKFWVVYIPCTSDRFHYLVSSICFITPLASLATSPCVLVPSSVQALYPLLFCLIDPKGIFTTGQNFRKAGHQTQNMGRDKVWALRIKSKLLLKKEWTEHYDPGCRVSDISHVNPRCCLPLPLTAWSPESGSAFSAICIGKGLFSSVFACLIPGGFNNINIMSLYPITKHA